jgi:hypothetical protein
MKVMLKSSYGIRSEWRVVVSIFLFDRYLAILIYEVSEKQYKFIVHIYVGFPCTRKLLNLRDPRVLARVSRTASAGLS